MKTLALLMSFCVIGSVNAETVQEYRDRVLLQRELAIRQMLKLEKVPCKELTGIDYPQHNTWTFRCDGKDYMILQVHDDFVVLENP